MKSSHLFSLLIAFSFATVIHAQQRDKPLTNFVIPPYFIANCEVYIEGPFDGDGSNTFIRFENNKTESFDISPIIESKNKLLIKVPETFGEYELIIADEGNNSELFIPVRIVYFKMDYDKNISRPGKRTDFKVTLLGVENMDEQFTFSMKNMSPYIISIQGGNY